MMIHSEKKNYYSISFKIICSYTFFLNLDDIAIAPAKLSLPSTSSSSLSPSLSHNESNEKNNHSVRKIFSFHFAFNFLYFICECFIYFNYDGK